ncbi:MAG: endonuclease [Bacteroidales bacterium]|nr:endonuclease [Bacteroidales bacterium]
MTSHSHALITLLSFFPLFTFFTLTAGEEQSDSLRVQHQRIMFWNVENAFWPADDSLREDDEFTPEGIRHWTRSRLRQKLLQLTRVIVAAGDGMAPMIVGLAEVEGDSAMHYWTHNTPLWDQHYNYIVSEGPDVRGIQTALLYQPTDFKLIHADFHRVVMPEGVRPTRDVLHAAGRVVSGDTLDVIVCHLPSRLGGAKQTQAAREAAQRTVMHVADSVRYRRRSPNIVIMGDMNDFAKRSKAWWGKDYVNLMIPLQKSLKLHPSAYGSHKYQGEWVFLDQFIVFSPSSPSLQALSALYGGSNPSNFSNPRVFHLPFMLIEDSSHLGHRPKRSYYGYQYEGGYSDHLPILLDFDVFFR